VNAVIQTPGLDPITFTVIWNSVVSIAEELGTTMRNTAFSEAVREGDDFSTAVFDAQGGMIAQGIWALCPLSSSMWPTHSHRPR
jgi:N-methylhydantoinase B/oxoprolinase/acetone carboxylase alpha subunit